MDNTLQDTDGLMVQPKRFLRKLDWSAFWTATIISLVVYVYTLAPTVTLEDSGELAVAGAYLGVPHPPGYPIWSMLAWVFTKIFSFVKYMGQPNPAWSIGFMSAFFGALATGLTAMLVCRSGSDLLRVSRDTLHKQDHRAEDVICWVGGVVASLLFAFSPVMWSQAVIVEVYTLNAFFLVLIFLLTYRWMCNPSPKVLFVTAFVFGLGLTNYQVLLLAGAPLAIVIFLKDIRLFRDFLVVSLPLVLLFTGTGSGLITIACFGIMLVTLVAALAAGDVKYAVPLAVTGLLPLVLIALFFRNGALDPNGIVHPLSMSCALYLGMNFLILGLGFFMLPNGKQVAVTLLLAELGVAFYGYMPLVSELRKPLPMNWGYPRTWEGFKHAVTRGQYEKYVLSDVLSKKFIHQIGFYFSDLRIQFTMLTMPLGFLPFTLWRFRAGGRRFNALSLAVGLMVPAVVISQLAKEAASRGMGGLAFAGEFVYKALLAGMLLLLVVGVLKIVIDQVAKLFHHFFPPHAHGVVSDEPKPFVNVLIDHMSQQWMLAIAVGFIFMSVFLIVLCNPKCDIQDNFIQKVKFISSHALYAFWIGYGLIFSLAFVGTRFKDSPAIRWLALGCALLLPVVPVYKNAFDKELLRVYGGADMHGHDYGWQFGNYQLRGAEAIIEELSPDEEPLPNPDYPPDMGPDAIFFGGTDPGRFVPTYMIYGADVRPDVFLITQNALADNTYMAVMRDLYGDDIWIPAIEDSAGSFQRYVEEVRSGKRPKNADLTIENGRVQVSGALGVMEINGILAQMMFEHNNYKNDFYVEESYVIRWMYPYLEPHGLIMKINRDTVDLRKRPDRVTDDLDLWDWYTRRLASDPKFLRDIVARKSFSKLRSALAGLYANRMLFPQAEQAFHESRILYPLSPEANFRLVQEVLFPYRRFPEARDILQEFWRQDPNNLRVEPFLNEINRLEMLFTRITALENQQRANKGALPITEAVQLAHLYQQARLVAQLRMTASSILRLPRVDSMQLKRLIEILRQAGLKEELGQALDKHVATLSPNTAPDEYLQLASWYTSAGQMPKTGDMIGRYLRLRPTDWKAWIDMGLVHMQTGNGSAAVNALQQAINYGGNQAMASIMGDQRFAPLHKYLKFQRPKPGGITLPGITPLPGPGGGTTPRP